MEDNSIEILILIFGEGILLVWVFGLLFYKEIWYDNQSSIICCLKGYDDYSLLELVISLLFEIIVWKGLYHWSQY